MAIDSLSPIAPARIRALLLPVGRIKRSRFLDFVNLLQSECMVRLGDVSPDSRPDRNLFSPLAFPSGTLLYDLSTSLPPAAHIALSPFEQFREPLLVIGVGDAAEYSWLQPSRDDDRAQPSDPKKLDGVDDIQNAIEDLREQYPRAYVHSLMMFDCCSSARHAQLHPETILVPPAAQRKTTTMKTFMCDITSMLLGEMTTLAKSIQALPTIASPASQVNGTGEGTPNWASSESLPSHLLRRSSQALPYSRPESPSSASQRDLHRMSMPVLPSSGVPLPDDSRPSTPTAQGATPPPTTFDEIPGVNTSSSLSRTNSNSSKPRDSSADRVSIHGFGSGGVGERARNKGRGRVGIVIGTLYLCAGQWGEALRELTEGAMRARAFSDHLWHAKALENILVCLLLFAWSGLDFQIPPICSPVADKSSGAKSPQHTPSGSVADISVTAPAKSSSHTVALEHLNSVIPDLVNMILSIYIRASNFAGESFPPLAFSQCVVRFSKLLTAMNLSAGSLDEDALQHIVNNTPLRQKPRLSVPRLNVNPTRNDIATILFRAMPGPPDQSGMSATDRVVVLAGIASVLSALGLQRKKAIVMKEFITSLIPGLVQARKVGAAEMGVHPAAGLAALNMLSGSSSGAGALNLGEGEIENGIDDFLMLLGRIYGIPDLKSASRAPGSRSLDSQDNEATSAGEVRHSVIEGILQTSSVRAFGSLSLKLELLRMCIHFCEALPDFNGVLHFTSLLLRVAGPGTAPKSNSTDVYVSISRDEQVRMYANVSRTVAAAKKLGLNNIETEYWDDFLVRGLDIMEEPIQLRLTHHRPAELKAVTAKAGPFIHNPWVKQPASNAVETILVANEQYRFVIALQNPYDFELEVDSLRIAGEGVEFIAHEEMFILGPYRTQRFPITAMATSTGTLRIIGCYIKVTGCHERLFPMFKEPWKPERESKMKRTGLKACLGAPASRPSSATTSTEWFTQVAPTPETLTYTIIPDQPIIIVTDVSLPQASVMVLEGERKRFKVTVQNTSQTTSVDFVHITFQDSATAALQTATTNRDLAAAELHELETQVAHFPSLRWCKEDELESFQLKPGRKASFEIEVVGRTRLTDAIIQIDYANLGKRRSEITDRFFTRQVFIPISITVNASVQLQRIDMVPLSGDFAWSDEHDRSHDVDIASDGPVLTPSAIILNKNDTQFQPFLRETSLHGCGGEYCMVLLDLRNSWPNPLSVSLQVRPTSRQDENSEEIWNNAYTVNEVIQPGHVNRTVLILPKVYIKDSHAVIPSLNPANQRQFVVSTSKISPEVERTSRETFWYRHELLKLVRGTWKEEGNGRHGDIELRNLRLGPRMVEAMRLEDIAIDMDLVSDYPSESNQNMQRFGRTKFQVPVDGFLTLKTKIQNRSQKPVCPLLRLQPHLAGLPHNIALDLDKRFSWSGVLQRKLPVLDPGTTIETELGIIALCSGTFEIGATVEEIETPQSDAKETNGRPRSNTAALLRRDILGEPKLRAWHMREPCTIFATRGLIDSP
ncbi:Trs120-domain-containing protein [Amniculicola lignicola CBS 123094]|uniref:Trs120-domain-containing protein n=1 Tax=Amniculicola lignicola CBS 123094 TaxID=1392246 RepID=A0A6A5WZ05_9PLEO|nr:Trs120-domain-containing protein [Amniculicola lignicola CBS 123094]